MACEAFKLNSVMPAALVPGIHVFLADPPQSKTWMAGTSPAMTELFERSAA